VKKEFPTFAINKSPEMKKPLKAPPFKFILVLETNLLQGGTGGCYQ